MFFSYPHAVGKNLEDALHREHARKAPVEVLKRFREGIGLPIMLLTYRYFVCVCFAILSFSQWKLTRNSKWPLNTPKIIITAK